MYIAYHYSYFSRIKSILSIGIFHWLLFYNQEAYVYHNKHTIVGIVSLTFSRVDLFIDTNSLYELLEFLLVT